MRETSVTKRRGLSAVLILSLVMLFIGVSLVPASAQPIEVSIPDIQKTDDPAGNSPLLGQIVIVDGIVTALDPGDNGLDGYFIEEPEGGDWSGVYVADPTGNRPAIGDLIRITGRVDEIQGLTAVTDLDEFTVVSNENPLPTAQGITADLLHTNGEPWESVRVAVHAATVISENPDAPANFGEWLISDPTGASLRVGHLLGDYPYAPIEGDKLVMVRGIVLDSSGTFKIEPASSADILEQVNYTTIYEIQTVPEDAEDDASPLNGERVTTAGVVTGVFFPPAGGTRYVLEDPRGGQWSGVWVFGATAELPPRGAHVELTGTVREFFGRTELFEVDAGSILVHSVNNALPADAEIRTIDIATGRPSAESYEGVLVRTGQVTVTNANPDAPDDFGEWLIADAVSGASIRVDDLGDYTYEPVTGDELAFVRGPVDFTFNQFKIQPRDDNDIGTWAVTVGQARQRPLGEQVALQGLVTVPAGLLDAGFAMQDGTGGIYVFHEAGFAQSIDLGDVVNVTGILAEDHGRLQVVPADPDTDVQVVGIAPLPPPLPLLTGQIGETSEGWLVAVRGQVMAKETDRLVVDDGSGPVDVVIAEGTGIDLSGISVGQEVTVIGLSSQFDETGTGGGYRLMPRFQADIIPSGAAVTPSPTPTVTPPTTFTLTFPRLFKNFQGCTSRYTVINAGDLPATVLHELVDSDNNRYTLTDTLEPGEEKLYDLATAVFEPPLPDGFSGSGTIQADQPLTGSILICPSGGLTTVTISPKVRTVALGGVTTTSVQVLDAAGLYGVELHIEFDPAIVQVIDQDAERPGIQVRAGDLFASRAHFVAVNRADNEAGTIDFAISLLNPEPPIEGSGDVAVITWRGVSPGTTAIHLSSVDLSDQAGEPLPATLEDGNITVLPATATPTFTPTPTATPTSTPTPTATPTPEVMPTPTCDGGLCGGFLVVRAFYDFRCDGAFKAGVDQGIGGAQVTLTYDNGSRVVTRTIDHDFGYAYFSGVNLPAGATATLSIEWPAVGQATLLTCPNARDSITLTAGDFAFGSRTVHFRAYKTRP